VAEQPGRDEAGAWRLTESLLTPRRPGIRLVARALLLHPRPLPCPVVAALVSPVLVSPGLAGPP
jgi:hypothetical protein